MTYFDFMLAFCGEDRIDKSDFQDTLQSLMDRNGVRINMYDYFEKIVTDNLSLIVTDTVTLPKSEHEKLLNLKRLRLSASEQFAKINNLTARMQVLVDALVSDNYNNEKILCNINDTANELSELCNEYEKLINS